VILEELGARSSELSDDLSDEALATSEALAKLEALAKEEDAVQ
jgi:hypothetical protein